MRGTVSRLSLRKLRYCLLPPVVSLSATAGGGFLEQRASQEAVGRNLSPRAACGPRCFSYILAPPRRRLGRDGLEHAQVAQAVGGGETAADDQRCGQALALASGQVSLADQLLFLPFALASVDGHVAFGRMLLVLVVFPIFLLQKNLR